MPITSILISSQYVETLDGYDTIYGESAVDNIIVDSGIEDDVITFQAEVQTQNLFSAVEKTGLTPKILGQSMAGLEMI